jgi:hypothetical protein
MATIAHDLIEGLADRDKAFYAALRSEDDLGMVVRAHIHIEHELRNFILAAAPKPAQVKFSEMDFEATVRMALILGLHPEFKSALIGVGRLRNKFSHRLDMTLGDEEVKNLYNSLGPQAKEVVQHSYARLRADFPEISRPKSVKKLAPKDLTMLCFVSVRGGVIIERLRCEGKL